MAKSFDSIDAYIASLPEAVQPLVDDLRRTILEAAPDATQAIKYNMPAFRLDGTYLIYLGAWKKHIGLYPVASGDAAFEAMVAPYRTAKDTIRFALGKPIPHDLVTRIVKARLAQIREA
jgi:uncharacterized protein YdhG (YjbR/CyaY superfamily)